MTAMLEIKRDKSDLFDSKAQTLVNTVNTVGVMGKGIALGFRKRFPEMYADYVARCERGLVRLGEPYLYQRAIPPWIVNFPTKQDWRSLSRLEAIVQGLEYVEAHYREWGITSLAVPPLGCGEGGLDWDIVGPTLFHHLSRLTIPVELYPPWDARSDQTSMQFLSASGTAVNARSQRKVTATALALVEILHRIEQEPYHYPIGRITFQKLAYFATTFGIPTGLEFERGSYGPFARGLKRLASQLVNNGLLVETPHRGSIRITTGRTYGEARSRFGDELLQWEREISSVSDLLVRMNGREAEIAATVHFAANHLTDPKASEADVLAAVKEWKARRNPPLADDQVASTIRRLNVDGWVHLQPSRSLPVGEPDFAD